MHLVSFDLDGTLIDTRELNHRAYQLAGVDIPDYAWGMRWQSWLPNLVGSLEHAEKLHRKKINIYSDLLQSTDLKCLELPPAQLARMLNRQVGRVSVQVLTAASSQTTNVILNALGVKTDSLAFNLSYEAKKLALQSSVFAAYDSVTYIDDDARNVPRFRAGLPNLKLIHYTNQTFNELFNLLITRQEI
jgi:phosphoglycolate phosphatase-like HAD superfamily hydrolase